MLTQSLQSIWSLQLVRYRSTKFIQTRWQYSYSDGSSYSGEYGALTIFIIFLWLYVLFAAGLFCFHSFLLIVNLTSEEIKKGKRLEYMKDNPSPFNEGLFRNIGSVLLHNRRFPM